jgi:hypothetical protein
MSAEEELELDFQIASSRRVLTEKNRAPSRETECLERRNAPKERLPTIAHLSVIGLTVTRL